jgi:hypothetical protein
LNIRDDNGLSTVEMPLTPQKYSTTAYNLADADCVIAILDHTLVKNREQNRSTQRKQLYKPEEYSNLVRSLLDWLVSQRQKPPLRWVAFCLTKTDLLPDPMLSPSDVIQADFGYDMLTAIKEYSYRQDMAMKLFSVSSVGFLDGPSSSANFRKGQLMDTKRWIPWNIEKPFFWLLEEIERKKLEENGAYILRRLYARRRLKHYQVYPC